MTDGTGLPRLIDDAISAHGGRDRWRAVASLTAPLSISGSLWSAKGHDGVLADATVVIDPHRQHLEFRGFGPRRLHTWFEPGLVSSAPRTAPRLPDAAIPGPRFRAIRQRNGTTFKLHTSPAMRSGTTSLFRSC